MSPGFFEYGISVQQVIGKCWNTSSQSNRQKQLFPIENAIKNPQFNYIGVEIISNVLISGAEEVKRLNLKNVRFFNMGAELLQYTLPKNSIAGLYLNFSCPYPKHTYRNRRLTNPKFLDMYRGFLASGGGVFQKTDNKPFFEYSLQSYEISNYRTEKLTWDLYKSDYLDGNIATEYEKKFVSLGETICHVQAYPN